MRSLNDKYLMNNGQQIPCLGFGTYLARNGIEAYNATLEALKTGYRHIDTAAIYKNEESVGKAVKDSKINREEIFVTTKLWNADQGYLSTIDAFKASMKRLNLEYLDLYLIHWPIAKGRDNDWYVNVSETWKAMEELCSKGFIRSIGLSNFNIHHIEHIYRVCEIAPVINQIELHPGYNQKDLVEYCQDKQIIVESWSPLAQSRIINDPYFDTLVEKYSKSAAQICLRWHLQRNLLPLPKSVNPERIAQNADIFDFELGTEDMLYISNYPYAKWSGFDPDKGMF